MNTKHLDLISLGELLIDFTPGNEPHSFIRNPGGAPANVAVAVARLGLSAGFCGTVGDDDFGKFLIETMDRNNVEMICPKPVENATTTMAFVSLENGERSFTFARKPGADMMLSRSDILDSDLERTKVLNAGSCSLSGEPCSDATRYALNRANSLGKKVAFDMNYRDVFWKNAEEAMDAIRSILPFVDWLKISDEEMNLIGGEEVAKQWMKDYHLELLLITYGEKGAVAYLNNGSIIKRKGFAVDRVMDTTGAGDAFWGTLLGTLILEGLDVNEESVNKALLWANAAGAIAVGQKGAIPSLPLKEDLEIFINEHTILGSTS